MKIGFPEIDNVPSDPSIDYFINAHAPPHLDTLYHCPCCGYPTLKTRGSFDLCEICYWEDDGQDSHDADRVRGGPNGVLSLTMARTNFATLEACEASMAKHVRAPTVEEAKHRYDT